MKGILGLVSVWVLVVCEICNVQIQRNCFVDGSSLHLNHLLAQCMTNYDWPFGTLPFGPFLSYLDTVDLKTDPRTYSGHF